MQDPSPIFEVDADFAAAPDVFPPDCFNAGVLLVKPDIEYFKELLSLIEKHDSYDGGDTGFLNSILRDKWWNGNQSRLEYTWNC